MVNWDSYLEPPDYGEGEMSYSATVECDNEECADFEKEVEWDGEASWYGGSGSNLTVYIYYTCPTCGHQSEHSRDHDSSDFIDPDAGRDDDW